MGVAASSLYGRALAGWMDIVRRRAPVVVLVALALTAVALVYTLDTLVINTSTTDMISPDVPFRRNDLAFDRAFPQFDDLIVAVIDGATAEGVEAAAEQLADRLRHQEALFRSVYLPGGELFFRRSALLYLDVEELSELADRLAAAEPLLATLAEDPSLRGLAEVLEVALEQGGAEDNLAVTLRRIAAVVEAEGLGRPGALSWQALLQGTEESAAPRFVLVQPVLDYGSLKPAADAIAHIRRVAAELGIDAANGLRLRLTGSVPLDQEELESVELGGRTAGWISLLLVTALLVAGLGAARLVAIVVATLLMGLIWTAAFAALAVGQLNLISVAFAVLFIGLGVDFGIHMSLRCREELAGGVDIASALRRAGRGVGGALSLSAVAAAAGFYAFLPTDYRGLAELGLISGTGMFIALAVNLSVLPALLALFPPPAARGNAREPLLARAVERHRRAIVAAAVVLGLGGAATLPYVRFDFNPINLKDPSTESVATFLDLARDPDTSPYTADVVAANLDAAAALSERLEALPEVERAVTLAAFVPTEQQEKLALIDDMAFFLTPALTATAEPGTLAPEARHAAFERMRGMPTGEGEVAAAAARLARALDGLDGPATPSDETLARIEARLVEHLPRTLSRLRGALSAEEVTLADLPEEFRRRWLTEDGRARVQVTPAGGISDNSALRRFAEAVLGAAPTATGTPVIVTEASKAVVAAFREATLLAFVLIAAILLAVLRRLSEMVLVLAPLALAGVLTAAASVALGLSFNFANVIVLPLLLGLGVASGIHLVLRRRQERDGAAVLASSTPRAVLFSALTTVASFGSLALSGHRGMTSMGQLLTIALAFTLLATLVVLPSLMTRSASGGEAEPP